ncbi:hypothetical protein HN014_15150 [Aquimarina sp. TRL1]|uniref:hypothetical protein n=1 Tax=Aquimarina sp. (strain TRL1) TaxID=2736252 RepID=UPI001589BD38|nr:hypothetical protein [Aquimarina sp. TRL1]QKX06190.1 hypothetical protein HN014_15150 [Aquimarina sp. TRL1]
MVEKKDVEKLIIQNKKSNLKNHWKDAFSYNTTKYSGEIKQNEILIWRSSIFLRSAYPVYRLTFDQQAKLSGIKTEKNPYHKFLNKITIGFIVLLILGLILIANFKGIIIGVIVIPVIGTLLYLFSVKVRKYETSLLTEELKETIENIERSNYPQIDTKLKQNVNRKKDKEWTFAKIITRLLLYPFCLVIIYFSIVGLIKDGQLIRGIFAIAIALAYPIADILLIFRKNKNS